MVFARKNNRIPEFYTIFARKMPELYIIIAQKYFFSDFFCGGVTPASPVSYAYGHVGFFITWTWTPVAMRP